MKNCFVTFYGIVFVGKIPEINYQHNGLLFLFFNIKRVLLMLFYDQKHFEKYLQTLVSTSRKLSN